MSNLLSDVAWRLELPGFQKLILLAYCNRANVYGLAWPATAGLASDCGTTERTIENLSRDLSGRGLLEARGYAVAGEGRWIVRLGAPWAPGRGRLNVYRVLPGSKLGDELPAGVFEFPKLSTKGEARSPYKERSTFALTGEKGESGDRERAKEVRPNQNLEPEPPARARPRTREAVATRSTTTLTGAATPTPIDTAAVIAAIPDAGLRAVLTRALAHATPAGAAPSSSEPAAPEPPAPEPPQR